VLLHVLHIPAGWNNALEAQVQQQRQLLLAGWLAGWHSYVCCVPLEMANCLREVHPSY
jgi:hypothetical protein